MRRKLLRRILAYIQSIQFSVGLSIPAVSAAVASLFFFTACNGAAGQPPLSVHINTQRTECASTAHTHSSEQIKLSEIFELKEVKKKYAVVEKKLHTHTLLWQYSLKAEAKYYKVLMFVNTAFSFHRDFKYFVKNIQYFIFKECLMVDDDVANY